MPNDSVIRRSVLAYYANRLFANATFMLGIYLLFLTRQAGLSTTQALSLFVVQFGASIVFDFVGGGIADSFGRKRSYIAGALAYVVGFTIPVVFIRDFTALAILSVIAGIGTGLMSNTLGATISDLLDHDRRYYRQVNARSQMILFGSRAIASVAGGFMYLAWAPSPFIAESVAMVLAAIAVLYMHETQQRHPAATSLLDTGKFLNDALGHIRHTAPVILRLSLALGLAAYLAGDLMFTYLQPFFSGHGYSAATIGMLTADISLASALGSWLVQGLHHRGWRMGTIAAVCVAMAINGVGYITGVSAIILVTVFVQAIVNGFGQPTQRLVCNELTPPRIRASVMSASTTITSLCMMAGFLLSGVIADHGSARLLGECAVGFALCGLAVTWWPGTRLLDRPAGVIEQ